MKTIGIATHSAEGGALCFITACREGGAQLGEHMHPPIVLSAVPMGLSLQGWRDSDYVAVGNQLAKGVQQVADAGADFYVCPDNTAHIVLEQIANDLPIPGLHIADVVCRTIVAEGLRRAALLGTKWTMTGPVYPNQFASRGLDFLIPDELTRERLNDAIFNKLCQGIFDIPTTDLFLQAIGELKERGADCVVLGCTEIPLVITPENSPLPTLDSTRLLAKDAVRVAIREAPLTIKAGWIDESK